MPDEQTHHSEDTDSGSSPTWDNSGPIVNGAAQPSDLIVPLASSSLARTPSVELIGSTLNVGSLPLPEIPGYRVLELIGRGGMGVIYRAMQKHLHRPVALKMILAGTHASPESRLRFMAEAEVIARLQHPGIVLVHEFGTYQGNPYFALEYLSGGSLADKLRPGPLTPREAAELVRKLAEAVEAAHRVGVVHRDLKPANILLTEQGEPKVTDFGLAKSAGGDLIATEAILGTPSYMAPEQAGGDTNAVGPTADVYALGVILYECLTGRPPFRAATAVETLQQVVSLEPVSVRRLQPKVPRDLETICHKCLEKLPRRRYATAAALAVDLQRWVSGEPILARRSGIWERTAFWLRGRRAAILAALFLVLGLVLTTINLFFLQWNAGLTRLPPGDSRWLREFLIPLVFLLVLAGSTACWVLLGSFAGWGRWVILLLLWLALLAMPVLGYLVIRGTG